MLAQQYLGMDDEHALTIAHRASLADDPEAGNPLAGAEDAIRSAVDGINGWSFTPDAENTRDVKVEVKKVARLLALSGVDPTEAVNKAAKFVWENSVHVNGRMLTLDIPVPDTFADYAEVLIDRTAEKLGHEAEDISVFHTGGGTFMLVTRGLGWAISDDKGIVRFTIDDLIAVEDGELAKARADILRRRDVRSRFTPWDDGGVPLTGTRHFP